MSPWPIWTYNAVPMVLCDTTDQLPASFRLILGNPHQTLRSQSTVYASASTCGAYNRGQASRNRRRQASEARLRHRQHRVPLASHRMHISHCFLLRVLLEHRGAQSL